MSNVISLARRPYKMSARRAKQSAFFAQNPKNHEAYMLADLAKSGLTPEDIFTIPDPQLLVHEKALAGYVMPYFHKNGSFIVDSNDELIMWRMRQEFPQFIKAEKYTQPTKEELAKHGLPPTTPYLNPRSLEISGPLFAICEGEKKSASFSKWVGIPSIGIGGCENWVDSTSGKKEVIHPWILDVLHEKNPETIFIIPDADIWGYTVCRAYGGLANALLREGFKVEIVNPPDKIDDLIVRWGDKSRVQFDLLPHIEVDKLVQSRSSLARTYSLAIELSGKENKTETVQQHSSNVMKLLENHPAFPEIWRDLDTGRVMLGDREAKSGVSEMELANHFQHNFQFNKVTPTMMQGCIRAVAGKNEKSPMLEWIKAQAWDGKERLDTWLNDYWGVELDSYIKEISAKFFVAAYARMLHPGCKVDWMLVAVGPQGIGKTSMPKTVFKDNDVLLYGDVNDKDFHMRLHSGLCIVVDEVDSFNKREASFWKATLTTTEDSFRPPYGATVETHKRRSILYGTTNKHEFLHSDASGHRRYAPFEVTTLLKFKELEDVLPQLWAEAKILYEGGRVDYGNITSGSEYVESFASENVMKNLVIDAVDQLVNTNLFNWNQFWAIRVSDVQDKLGLRRGTSPESREIGNTLRDLGWSTRVIRHSGKLPAKHYIKPRQ